MGIMEQAVADVARRAVEARTHGEHRYSEGGHTFLLDRGGMCARFVRQCCEVAAGLPPFGIWFAAPTARKMEENLRAGGKAVPNLQTGDIIGFNRQSYPAGHIGIFIGDGHVAENTSSDERGDPRAAGTKITPLSALLGKVSGYFRPFEGIGAPRVIAQLADGSSQVVECHLVIEGGVSRVDLRALAEALGMTVTDHIADQGKVYVSRG